MDRAREYLSPWTNTKEVRWIDKLKSFIFPSGSRLSFGFLDSENDKFKFQGAEFQFIGIDEASQIAEANFLYMFSRLRRNKDCIAPLRFRSASNPSSDAMWLYDRYISPDKVDKTKIFIPAGVDDNPFLNAEEYKATLDNLDPITRDQLLNGSWTTKAEGGMFLPQWFNFVDKAPTGTHFVRAWDLASSDPNINKRADYTVGVKIGVKSGQYYIEDVVRFRGTPSQVDDVMLSTATVDGTNVPIYLPIDPGAAGLVAYEHYVKLLTNFVVKGAKNTGSKVDRAKPASSACEQGRINLIKASWNGEFIKENAKFPPASKSVHDDQVDAWSWGYNNLQHIYNINALPISISGAGSYWRGN